MLQAYKIPKIKITITRLDESDTATTIVDLFLLELGLDLDPGSDVTGSKSWVKHVKNVHENLSQLD